MFTAAMESELIELTEQLRKKAPSGLTALWGLLAVAASG